jgi:hypothetical protein
VNAEFKEDKYFVNEVKIQLREKSLRANPGNLLSEDKAST